MSWWQSLLWGKPAATREIQPARRVLLAKAGSTENLIEHFQAVQKNYRKFRSVDLTVTLSAVVDGWIAMDLGENCHPYVLHYTASRLHHNHATPSLAWSVSPDPRFSYLLGPDPRGGWRMLAGWREDGVSMSVSRINNQLFNEIDLKTDGNCTALYDSFGVPSELRGDPGSWVGVTSRTLSIPDFRSQYNPDLTILTPRDAHPGVVDIEMTFRSGAR